MPDVLAAPYPLVDLFIIAPFVAAVYFNLPFLSYSEIGFCFFIKSLFLFSLEIAEPPPLEKPLLSESKTNLEKGGLVLFSFAVGFFVFFFIILKFSQDILPSLFLSNLT